MTYAGVCYDGPLEGQQMVSGQSSFPIPMMEEVAYIGMPDYREQVPYRTCWYRWSHPLRKWVFEW